MDFDDLLRQSEASSQREKIGIAIYFLEEYQDKDSVKTSDVRELLESSRAAVSKSTIPQRVKDLRDDKLVKKAGEDGQSFEYVLTHDGFGIFEELSGDAEAADKIRDGRFIDTDKVDVHYYSSLVGDINKSYQYGINDGCMVLTRKLFENFIIDILRAEFGGKEIDLYYNTDKGRFHGLGTLTGNLREKSGDLDHYDRRLDDGLIDRVEQFKEHGNSQAHSVRVQIDDDEMEGMTGEATKLTEILYDIREEVRISNG